MRYDQVAKREQERAAYQALSSWIIVEHEKVEPSDPRHPVNTKVMGMALTPAMAKTAMVVKVEKQNPYYVSPKLITSPAMLIQEQAWVNTTQTFSFNFAINGPGLVVGTNNSVQISKNSVFAIGFIQLLFGTQSAAFGAAGSLPASTIYRPFGVLPADNALYNSVVQMKVESSTYLDLIPGQAFRDQPNNNTEFWNDSGMVIVNPIRIISGELGVLQVNVNILNPTSALVLSANTIVSCRLHGALGQAAG